MNQSDVPRIASIGRKASATIDRLGPAMYAATKDWESPLRSGVAGPSGKGDHADPVFAAVDTPDRLAQEHKYLVADLQAFAAAAEALTRRLEKLEPIDPNKVDRGRVNSVPACIVCDGPAVPCRRGMCDACRKAHKRAGSPELVKFRRDRRADLAPPAKEYVS